MTVRRPVDPSPNVIATIRTAAPDARPPDALVPHVVALHADDVIVDWELTRDAVALDDPDVVQRFRDWRARWATDWVLDPYASVLKLIAIADQDRPDEPVPNEAGHLLARALGEGESGGIPVDRVARLRSDLEFLRDEIRAGGDEGFGFVDATPGSTRVGLAGSWSPATGEETLAASMRLAVVMDPANGLGIEMFDEHGEVVRRFDSIDSVEVVGEQLVVSNADDRLEIDVELAAPLVQLVPGATHWRVRRVPEVLVWARTISGLIDCCELAAKRGVPIVLTTARRVE